MDSLIQIVVVIALCINIYLYIYYIIYFFIYIFFLKKNKIIGVTAFLVFKQFKATPVYGGKYIYFLYINKLLNINNN